MFFAPVGIQTCKKLISDVTGRLVKNAFTPQTCMPTFKKFAVRVEIELFLKTSILLMSNVSALTKIMEPSFNQKTLSFDFFSGTHEATNWSSMCTLV